MSEKVNFFLSAKPRYKRGFSALAIGILTMSAHGDEPIKENVTSPGAIVVTSLADNETSDGLVTLREAIRAALTDSSVDGSVAGSGPDLIEFDSNLVTNGNATIELALFSPGTNTFAFGPTAFLITNNITISGPSGENGIILSRSLGSAFRFFHVATNGTLSLRNLTLTKGEARGFDGGMVFGGTGGGAAGMGGAVFNQGVLNVHHCTLFDNLAVGGNGGQRPEFGSDEFGGGGGGVGGPGQGGPNNAIGGLPNPGGHNLSITNGGYGGGGGGGFNFTDIGWNGGFGGGGGGSRFRNIPSNFAFAMAQDAGAGGFGGGGGAGGYASANFSGNAQGGAGGDGGFGGGGGAGGNGVSNPSSSGGQGGAGGFGGGSGKTGDGGEQSDVSRRSGQGGGGAGMGGALFSDKGTMVVVNSTLSGNFAQGGSSFSSGTTPGSGGGGGGLGGAIFQRGGSLAITNCTIVTNIVIGGVGETNGFGEAGGILVVGDGTSDGDTANFSMNNTIVALSGGATYDLFATNINSGTVNDSGSGNLVESAHGVSLSIVSSADPLLGVLSDNRGPTFTHALLDGSPAIDAGVANNLTSDQRILFVRVADGDLNGSAEIDIGSFELLFKDYGDAPDFGSGTGTSEVFQSVGNEAFRISVMGNDAESNNSQRTRFEAVNPDIAYNAVDNEYLVVWYGEDDTAPLVDNEDEIHGVRIDAETGQLLGNQFRISFMGNDAETNRFVRDDFQAVNPSVAWNSIDREYFVVWYGDDDQSGLVDNEREIFGQRIDTTGGLVGNRIRVSQMGTDGSANFGAFHPDVTHNATDNEYLVVWQADDNTPPVVDNENEIYAQRISGAGALVAGRIRVSIQGNDAETNAVQRTRSRPSDARVTWNSTANQYLVVWSGDTDVLPTIDNENEIWGSILSNVGSVINGNFRISVMGPNGSTLYRAGNPDVTYNSTDNQYLVVWYGDHDQNGLIDNEYEIFGKVLNASAGTVADQFRISDMGPDQVTSFFAFSATADYNPNLNRYTVVWRSDNLIDNKLEIYGQQLSNAGVEVGENDFFVGNTGPADDTRYTAQNPAIAFSDAQQEHLVIWQGDDDTFPLIDNENEVFGQRILDGVVVDYATLDADSGPSHFGSLTLRIGSLLDSEANGQPGLLANGDDTIGLDDEDGIGVVEYFPNGFFTLFVDVFNSIGSNATLYGWMDLDVDGVFELSERRSATVTNGTAGPVALDWGSISSAATNDTYLRLRLSSDSAAASPSGEASDGEVEDHLIVSLPASGLGLPVITVTTMPTMMITNTPSIVVEGEANRHAVAINWTNSLNGASGTFTPSSIWSIGSIPLGIGDNQLTFTGTNLLGDASTALLLVQVEDDCNENGIADSTEPDGFSVAPVGRWQFEESSGTVALDGAGMNDGTLVGGVTRTNGAQERGLSLDGTTGYVTIPDNDALDFAANEDFAFAIWLKIPSNQVSTVNGDNDIVEKWQGGGEGYPYVLRLLNQTTVSPGAVNVARYNGTDVVSVSSTNTINDDKWHHVAVSRNSGMLSIYIDGTLDSSIADTITGVTENTSPIFLGRRGTGENPVTGSLDEFVVFGQGLSDAQVNELYQLGLGNGVVDDCEVPLVDITQSDRTVGFLFSETGLTGTSVNVVGDLAWTNSLTGESGTFPASTNWQTTSPIALGVGTNVITVSGANAARIVSSDQIVFTRTFLLDDGGATPIHYVSLSGGHVWPFTNWLDAATNVQTAVDTAFDGDTVLVTNGVYNVGGAPTPGGALLNRVVVDRAITVRSVNGADETILEGQGPIGATAVRGVYLANNAALNGFTITNGFTHSLAAATVLDQNGGGAFITGGGSMISCVVVRCSSSLSAGGIYGDTVGTIQDSTIAGNVSWLVAGGISLSNTGMISGCSISNNALTFANASRGGGVAMFGSDTLLTNSIISSNVALHAGGAIVHDGDVILCTFQHNQAMAEGGGLVLEQHATVFSSTFFNNSAVTQGGGLYRDTTDFMAITNCHFIANTSGTSGGGIWSDGQFYLWHCTFRGNNAMTGSGGGISSRGSCRFFNCLFTGNQAGLDGGGIHGLVQFIKNTTMSGNKALAAGGALGVFNGSQTAAMENTILWNNEAAGVSDTVSASFANLSTGQSSFQNCLVDNAYNSGTWDPLLGSDLGGNFDVSPEFVQPLSPASSPSPDGIFPADWRVSTY